MKRKVARISKMTTSDASAQAVYILNRHSNECALFTGDNPFRGQENMLIGRNPKITTVELVVSKQVGIDIAAYQAKQKNIAALKAHMAALQAEIDKVK